MPHRRDRDLEILDVAKQVASGHTINQLPVIWEPQGCKIEVAHGYPGYLQTDLEAFWHGIFYGAFSGDAPVCFHKALQQTKAEVGDQLLMQAFFLSTASLIRKFPDSKEISPDITHSEISPWPDLISRGIRRAFNTIYGGTLTGNAARDWSAQAWCHMAASWVPKLILTSDKNRLIRWCESLALL